MRAPRRTRPLRLFLTVAAGVVVLLCLGGLGVAVTLYDRATTLQHEDPDIVLSNYLRAFLIEKNDTRAGSLTCGNASELAPIHEFRQDVENRERSFNVGIMISWGSLTVASDGEDRVVTTDLTRSVSNAQQAVETWRFRLVEEGGWKVCAAQPEI